MSDSRVPLDPILAAFGVPATVTRTDYPAVATTVVWVPPGLEEPPPYGGVMQRREPRRILAVQRTSALPIVEPGTVIVAPEQLGAVTKTWLVDSIDRVDVDEVRAIVKVQTER